MWLRWLCEPPAPEPRDKPGKAQRPVGVRLFRLGGLDRQHPPTFGDLHRPAARRLHQLAPNQVAGPLLGVGKDERQRGRRTAVPGGRAAEGPHALASFDRVRRNRGSSGFIHIALSTCGQSTCDKAPVRRPVAATKIAGSAMIPSASPHRGVQFEVWRHVPLQLLRCLLDQP